MKATINGIQVEGTPEEIASFVQAMEPAREDSEDRKTNAIFWSVPHDQQGRPITWAYFNKCDARPRGVYIEDGGE